MVKVVEADEMLHDDTVLLREAVAGFHWVEIVLTLHWVHEATKQRMAKEGVEVSFVVIRETLISYLVKQEIDVIHRHRWPPNSWSNFAAHRRARIGCPHDPTT